MTRLDKQITEQQFAQEGLRAYTLGSDRSSVDHSSFTHPLHDHTSNTNTDGIALVYFVSLAILWGNQ
jgi:hypothetical protein